MKVRTTST